MRDSCKGYYTNCAKWVHMLIFNIVFIEGHTQTKHKKADLTSLTSYMLIITIAYCFWHGT